MGKFTLILVLGGMITFSVINLSMNGIANRTTENALAEYEQGQARNIANSTVEMIISKIADETGYRTSSPVTINVFGGTATYTVKDTTVMASSLYTYNPGPGKNNKNILKYETNLAGFGFLELDDMVFAFIKGGKDKDKEGDDEKGKGKKDKDGEDDGHGGHGHGDGDHGDDDDNDGGGGGSNSGGNDISAIKVTVTAEYSGIEKTVSAIITPETTSGNNLPQFFNYALLSGQSVNLNGNVNITDDNNSQWNANVHTNQNFSMNGNNSIAGFVTYGGTAHSNPSWRMDTQITPNQNPDGQPNYDKTGQVDIPEFNAADFKDKATQIYNTNKTLSGDISLGTKENPEIIYINGDLNLKGTVSGYGSIIVKGNINISGNLKVSSPDPNYSNLGLYTGGNINASGNVDIHAQVFANQNINLSGNCKIYGTMTTRGVNNFSGNVDIYYHPANSVLTQPFWPQGGPDNSSGNNIESVAGGSTSHRMSVLNWYE